MPQPKPNPLSKIRNKLILMMKRIDRIKEANKGTKVEKDLDNITAMLMEEINQLP